MTDVSFSRLHDVALREAWMHEANHFTPWLAANIEHIADAVRIELEVAGTEKAVGDFAADILARNPQDDTMVLIENQLEQTDHRHLGQIMTYLSGLEARTVIWIAPSFREEHLSAIRWLNEHTADGFSFFALRLRVVRIDDSPYAPIFEVVEKPNGWDRDLNAKVKAVESDLARRRAAFWTAYLERYPEAAARGLTPSRHSNVWLPAPPEGTILGLYAASRTSGVYLRGPAGSNFEKILAQFMPYREQLEARLGAPIYIGEGDWMFISKISHPISDEERWTEIIDWMEERSALYLATLTDLFAESTG